MAVTFPIASLPDRPPAIPPAASIRTTAPKIFTIDCSQVDESGERNLVRGGPATLEQPGVMVNAFGFGGQNAVLILKRG